MRNQKNWQELLIEAVNQPGKIMAAYTAFHNYSIGNALLALSQCHQRNLTPGPLNTYKGWQELGRYVRKGEQALTLCTPVSAKKKKTNPETKQEEERILTYFVYRSYWFTLCQTGGDKPYTLPTPRFDLEAALSSLEIQRIDFDMLDGNVQGLGTALCERKTNPATVQKISSPQRYSHDAEVLRPFGPRFPASGARPALKMLQSVQNAFWYK
jgi:hypothetical protein